MLLKKEYYLIPIRDMVIFPESSTILVAGRSKSILAIEKAYINNENIFCITQKNKDVENITNKNELFEVGTLCEITQKINLPNGDIRITVKGIEKYRLEDLLVKDGCFVGVVKDIRKTKVVDNIEELEQIKKIVLNKANSFLSHYTKNSIDLMPIFASINSNNDIVYILTNILNIDIQAKQSILEERSLLKQYVKLNQFLEIEKSLIDVEKEINDKIDRKMQEHQKQFYLKEKLKGERIQCSIILNQKRKCLKRNRPQRKTV